MPKPKETDWDFELPEEQQELNGEVELSEEDAAQRDRRNQVLREASARAEFKRRTQVLQRALPRPSTLDIDALSRSASETPSPIERAIAKEMALLIANDAYNYPLQGSKISGVSKPLDIFEDDDLDRARLEIALEMPSDGKDERVQQFSDSWTQMHTSASGLLGLGSYEDEESNQNEVIKEALEVSNIIPNLLVYIVLNSYRIFKA